MNSVVSKLLLILMLLVGTSEICAAQFSAKVVDGLGKPICDVKVQIIWSREISKDKLKTVKTVSLYTDSNGLVEYAYDKRLDSRRNFVTVAVSKLGYGLFATGMRSLYVLKRRFSSKDIEQISMLTGVEQKDKLKEVLTGNFTEEIRSLEEIIFSKEKNFRPVLCELLGESEYFNQVSSILAFIGNPQDIRLIIKKSPLNKKGFFQNRWAYNVACAVFDPISDEEWAFIRKCVINEYEDRWVDAGAISTLKLVASLRSLEILQEAQKKNTYRVELITEAINYITSNPSPISDMNLEETAKKLAQIIKVGKWKGNNKPYYNEDKDKAIVDLRFVEGRDLLIYTATFHKVEGLWKLRGVRETMQTLLANIN